MGDNVKPGVGMRFILTIRIALNVWIGLNVMV